MCTSSFTTFQVRQKNVPIVGFEPGKLEGGGVWGGVIVVAMSDGVRNGKVPSCKQTVARYPDSGIIFCRWHNRSLVHTDRQER